MIWIDSIQNGKGVLLRHLTSIKATSRQYLRQRGSVLDGVVGIFKDKEQMEVCGPIRLWRCHVDALPHDRGRDILETVELRKQIRF